MQINLLAILNSFLIRVFASHSGTFSQSKYTQAVLVDQSTNCGLVVSTRDSIDVPHQLHTAWTATLWVPFSERTAPHCRHSTLLQVRFAHHPNRVSAEIGEHEPYRMNRVSWLHARTQFECHHNAHNGLIM